MSFQDDPKAQVAKIARFEAQLDIQKALYDSKIKELEQKISSLEEKNSELELEKRLSTTKLQDQPTRPAVARDSSDFALHPEVIKLRHDSEVKDRRIFYLQTALENCQLRLTTIQQGLIGLNKGFHDTTEDFSKVVQDLGVVLKPETGFNKLQSGLSSPVADTAAGPSQSSQSASRSQEIRAGTPAGPYQPTRSASEAEKVATLTGSASTTSPTSDYAQAVSPKPSSVDDSTKSSQEVTLPVEQEVTSDQPLLDTPSPETASPDSSPVGFQFPYEGRHFQNESEVPEGFNPYADADLEGIPALGADVLALLNESDEDKEVYHVSKPQQSEAFSMERTTGFKSDEEPVSEAPQSSNHV